MEEIVIVEAATQDEAVRKADALAKEKGFNKASLKNVVSIKYSVLLYDPIKEEKSKEEIPSTPSIDA